MMMTYSVFSYGIFVWANLFCVCASVFIPSTAAYTGHKYVHFENVCFVLSDKIVGGCIVNRKIRTCIAIHLERSNAQHATHHRKNWKTWHTWIRLHTYIHNIWENRYTLSVRKDFRAFCWRKQIASHPFAHIALHPEREMKFTFNVTHNPETYYVCSSSMQCKLIARFVFAIDTIQPLLHKCKHMQIVWNVPNDLITARCLLLLLHIMNWY